MDGSRPPLPGQSADHGEKQQQDSRQSIGHADQLRRLQRGQPLSAAGDGGERRLAAAPKSGTLPLRTGWKTGSDPEVNGWTGSIDTIKILQDAIQEFTAHDNQLLGQYFGDKRKGWPFYNIPNPPNAPRKIPSGANVFPESPLKADTR